MTPSAARSVDARQLHLVLRTVLVEEDQPFARAEAQRTEMTEGRADDADARGVLRCAGNEEPQHHRAGRSTRVHHPSAR